MNPGFTPAYAGNTLSTSRAASPAKVHPRIRGEYPRRPRPRMSTSGSPPHTRGIPEKYPMSKGTFRFTPAYAGNTRISTVQRHVEGVHPRIRGEYSDMIVSFCDFRGSPPHTRGILRDERFDLLRNGFTPAYAGNTVGLKIGKALAEVHPRIRGNTRPCQCRGLLSQVHPRIRGEYGCVVCYFRVSLGSPPHTRGILWVRS